MRIGIFGGTFDPPHMGHMIAAQELCFQLDLDRLLIMPAAVPPHKRDLELTRGDVRLRMTWAAFVDDQRWEVSEMELEREGPSYTVDTLRALRDEYPDAELVLALGADQIAELHTWREPEEVARLATLAGFARSGQEVPDVEWPVKRVEVPTIELSSTEVRRRVRDGEPYKYMVPPGVEALIEREKLYRP